MKNKIESQVHLFTVNNDVNGKTLIEAVRKQIRESKTHRRIVLYGRGHRFGKSCFRKNPDQNSPSKWIGSNEFQSHVPMNLAQKIAVYIEG